MPRLKDKNVNVSTGVVTETLMTLEEEVIDDARIAQLLADKPKKDAEREIQRLEATITPRRIRDALSNDEGKEWVASVEALIATERAKL